MMIPKILIKYLRIIFREIQIFKKIFYRKKISINTSLLNGYPIERDFGSKRGSPIDRYYIESFIKSNKKYIKGRILEIGDNLYSKDYANINQINVLRGKENRDYKNFRGDLLEFESINKLGQFDTLIVTNVLNVIYDFETAIKNIAKLTSDQGKCLITVSGLSGLSKFDNDRWGDYWRFSKKSLYLSLYKYFNSVEIQSYGNASVASSMILGIVKEDLPVKTIMINDEDYPVIISGLVAKPKREK